MFERQLEDVSPADAAEVDLLRRAVGGATQHKELWEAAQFNVNNFEVLYMLCWTVTDKVGLSRL